MSVAGVAAVMSSMGSAKNTAMKMREENDQAVSPPVRDSLELSLTANVMTPDVEPKTPGSISIGDIGEQIIIDRKSVDSQLNAFMVSLGIAKDTKFTLTTTRTGRIVVDGDFQGKEKLENALNNNRDFKNTYMRLSANSSLMEAAKRSIEFQKEYEIDPRAAVAKYAYLLNDSTEYRFTYTFENGSGRAKVDVVTLGGYAS